MNQPISVCWFRRDLRLNDHTALYHALHSGLPVLAVFMFDTDILNGLKDPSDRRVSFIWYHLQQMNKQLKKQHSAIKLYHGKPSEIWKEILNTHKVAEVYWNEDYEPYGIKRDAEIKKILENAGITVKTYKDHVIFSPPEILKKDGSPFRVFTPYSRAWKQHFYLNPLQMNPSGHHLDKLAKNIQSPITSLMDIGFQYQEADYSFKLPSAELLASYHNTRDIIHFEHGTSQMSSHLRFGTVSVRELVLLATSTNETYLNELIWREFFMMILWHYPHTVDQPFNKKYDQFPWNENRDVFKKWKEGKTGIPIVDAGMRQLIATGTMHNRVRMITANFLTKVLRVWWKKGERHFADYLMDFELSSNVGNWQWAAGTGCDASPYFRIFNPFTQQQKFDPEFAYIKRWLPEYGTDKYPSPMIDYHSARKESLEFFKNFL
ncbi:MAG: deoxyribodipyrimidine photo-lyase [Calditrichia bacterium]